MSSAIPSNLHNLQDELEAGDYVYAAAFIDGLKPDPKLTVSQWADQFRFVSQVSSPEPGLWRTQRTPYLREIMDCLSVSSPVREVVFKKATQVGGTETGNNWIGYIISHAPGPTMMVLPTSNAAKRASKQRIKPLIDETPELTKRVKPPRERDSGNTVTMKDFIGGVLVMAGANSATELKSMPAKNLFMDEIDEYPADLDDQGDPVQLAEKRLSNFPRSKILKVSTPTVKGFSRIDEAYTASDQRHYQVPCPHCDVLQVLKWEQVRWQVRRVTEYLCQACGVISFAENVADTSYVCPECNEVGAISDTTLTVRDTDEILRVWYECEHCQAEIDEYEKQDMLEHGRWTADNPGPDRAAGFHLPALYSPNGWYSWRDAVKEYLASEGKPNLRKVWINTVLGEAYEDSGLQPDHSEIKLRSETYRQGIVPMGGLLLVGSVDVQAKRLEVKIKAFGRDEESWLVQREVIHGDTAQDEVWKALDEFLKKDFSHEGGAILRLTAVAIDSGYNTQYVYNFCRSRRRRHIFPVKGVPGEGRTALGSPSKQDVDFRGRKIKKGIQLWPLGVDTIKKLVYDRLNIEQPGPRYMHFPFGLPDEYFEQLTAEKQLTRFIKGFPKREWVKDPNQANEALDLEVYCYAAALYAGLTRKNWDKLEQRLNLNQADLFNQAGKDAENNSLSTHQSIEQQHKAAHAAPGGRHDADDSDRSARDRKSRKPYRKPKRGGFVNSWK